MLFLLLGTLSILSCPLFLLLAMSFQKCIKNYTYKICLILPKQHKAINTSLTFLISPLDWLRNLVNHAARRTSPLHSYKQIVFVFYFITCLNNRVRCAGWLQLSLTLNFLNGFLDRWFLVRFWKIELEGWIKPLSLAISLILSCGIIDWLQEFTA